jgi:hypothetical protein
MVLPDVREEDASVTGHQPLLQVPQFARSDPVLMQPPSHAVKLRHTFCSHLAMKGAPVKAIQELAGHTDLKQTLRYMHLSPSVLDAAIALLNPAKGEATAGATLAGSR